MGFSDLFSSRTEPSAAQGAAPGDGSSGSDVDLATLEAHARAQSRALERGRGKRKKSQEQELRDADLDLLFADENWQVVSSLPFQARYAMTGWDGFLLDAKEKEILGRTMGTAMRVLLRIDPRYIAVIVFGANMTAFLAEKEIRYKKLVTEKKSRAAS